MFRVALPALSPPRTWLGIVCTQECRSECLLLICSPSAPEARLQALRDERAAKTQARLDRLQEARRYVWDYSMLRVVVGIEASLLMQAACHW